jgi:hypothetical protein
MIQAILINPRDHAVTAIELSAETGGIASLLDARYFEAIVLRRPEPGDPGAAVFLDEEAREKPDQRFWAFRQHPERIFAGKGLITAVNENGDSVEGVADPSQIEPHIIWRDGDDGSVLSDVIWFRKTEE